MADASISADWAAVGITTIGMIISVGVVIFQLGKQHKGSLKLQRNNAREALKLRVYELIGEKAQDFSDTDSEAGSYARSIIRELESASWTAQIGFPHGVQELRAEKLSKLHFEASSALTELIVTIENWEIAFPAGELFRVALFSAQHDVEENFSSLFNETLRLLPTDMPDGKIIAKPIPSTEKLSEIQELVNAYSESRATLRSYTHDLVVEAQNLLLSKLFKHRVKIRAPIDPEYKVITMTDTEALMKYFKTETSAGKAMGDSQRNVRERLQAEGKTSQ